MEYKISISEQDIQVFSMALGELPYKISAPLIYKLNRQIAEQNKEKSSNNEKEKEDQ